MLNLDSRKVRAEENLRLKFDWYIPGTSLTQYSGHIVYTFWYTNLLKRRVICHGWRQVLWTIALR
jgi:hypothetical protein